MTVESLKRGADTPAVGETAETPNGAGAMTVDGEAQPEMTDTGPGDSVRSFESDCSCCRIVSSLQSALRPRSPSGRNCVDSCAPSELGRRSARHARHARRLCCLRLDGAGRLSRLGHKVDYVRRVPRVGEGGVVVHRDPSALLDGATFVLLTALPHPSTRRELERSDQGVRRTRPTVKLRPFVHLNECENATTGGHHSQNRSGGRSRVPKTDPRPMARRTSDSWNRKEPRGTLIIG